MKKIGENDIKYYFGYREDGSDIINFNEKFTVHFAVKSSSVTKKERVVYTTLSNGYFAIQYHVP